jgi:predicted transcriptional regulator
MNAYDICQRNVVTVRGHEDLATATWVMRERNVGCLVVVEPLAGPGGWRPVGMLSDRDIVTKVIAQERDPRGVAAADVMSPAVSIIKQSRIEDAVQRMKQVGTRRLAVVDERGRLSGILTFDDIFEYLTRKAAPAAAPLRLQPGRMGTDRI